MHCIKCYKNEAVVEFTPVVEGRKILFISANAAPLSALKFHTLVFKKREDARAKRG